jgi:hypothetical protein
MKGCFSDFSGDFSLNLNPFVSKLTPYALDMLSQTRVSKSEEYPSRRALPFFSGPLPEAKMLESRFCTIGLSHVTLGHPLERRAGYPVSQNGSDRGTGGAPNRFSDDRRFEKS